MTRSDQRSFMPRRFLRPLAWVLMCAGALSVLVTTVIGERLFRTNGTRLPVYAMAVCAVLALALMWAESPKLTRDSLRRLLPVIVFAAATMLTILVNAGHMAILLGARDGAALTAANARSFIVNRSVWPLAWVSAAVLGYAASRHRVFSLLVAAASVWVSVLASMVDLAQRAGLSTQLGAWYAEWSLRLGSWVPAPAERFRSVGLELDPNAFGLIGTVGLVFALSLEGSPKTRTAIAVGSVLVVALSGSRTDAIAAALACVAWVVPSLGDWSGLRRRARDVAPVAVAILISLAVVGVASWASGAHIGAGDRLATSAADVTSGVQGANVSAGVDEALSGRLAIWESAWHWYTKYPAGAFIVPEVLVGKSIHNEYLERLLWGGPLLLAALLYLLWWLWARVRPPDAPAFGPAMCAAYAAAAFALGPSVLAVFLGMVFYLIGWAASGQKEAAVQ